MVASRPNNLWLGVVAGAVAGALFGALLGLPGPPLRRRPDHRRRRHRRLLHRADHYLSTEQVLEPYQNTLNAGLDLLALGDPAARQDPGHRAGAFRPERLRLPGDHPPRRHARSGLFQHPLGPAGAGRRRAPRGRRDRRYQRASVRYRNVILGGVIAGIGGAAFTIGSVGEFSADMTVGARLRRPGLHDLRSLASLRRSWRSAAVRVLDLAAVLARRAERADQLERSCRWRPT